MNIRTKHDTRVGILILLTAVAIPFIVGCPANGPNQSVGWRYSIRAYAEPQFIEQLPGGGFYVVGFTTNDIQNGPDEAFALRLNATGDVVWERIVEGLHPNAYRPTGVRATSAASDALFVSGLTEDEPALDSDEVFLGALLDSNGDLIWEHAAEQTGTRPTVSFPSSPGGIASFHETSEENGNGPRLLILDDTGDVVSSTLVSGIADRFLVLDGDPLSSDMFCLVGASIVRSGNSSRSAPTLAKVGLDAETEWLINYPEVGYRADAVALRNDGLVAVAGPWEDPVSSRSRPYVMAVHSDGSNAWYQPDVVPPSDSDNNIWVRDITADSSNNTIIVGEEYGVDNIGEVPVLPSPYVAGHITQIGPEGNRNWTHKVQNAYFYAVCVAVDGTYYVAGQNDGDVVVLHFDQSGNILN